MLKIVQAALCCCRAFQAAAAVLLLWVCTAPRNCLPPVECGLACSHSWRDDAPSVCTASPLPGGGSHTNWGPTRTPGAPGGSCSGRCGSPGCRSVSPRLCTPSPGFCPGKLRNNHSSIKYLYFHEKAATLHDCDSPKSFWQYCLLRSLRPLTRWHFPQCPVQ